MPEEVSTDFIEQFVVARQEMLEDFGTDLVSKFARRQLVASSKTEAARNLGVWAMMGFLWEALVKAPKALFTSTTEAAGL